MTSTEISTKKLKIDNSLLSKTSIIGSYIGFLVIGAGQAIYGPLIPFFQENFAISPSMAGMSLSIHFIGALFGVLLFNRLDGVFDNRILVGVSYALIALGSVLFALISHWQLMLSCTFFIGLGFGGIDYGINHLFAKNFIRSGIVMLNLLNAHFGIGAVAAPLLVNMVGPENYSWIFIGLAIISGMLLLTLTGIMNEITSKHRSTQQLFSSGQISGVIFAFILVYALHVAIETGVGGWEQTHLLAQGYSSKTSALATSFFWFALTIGRFLVMPIGLVFSASAIFNGCCVGIGLCLLFTSFSVFAPFAYVGVGLFLAPIFPTGLVWLKQLSHASTPTAYVIAASMLGGIIFPPAIGALIERVGVNFVPLMLIVLAVGCTIPSIWLTKYSKSSKQTSI